MRIPLVRAKLQAAGWHLLATVMVASFAAWLVFQVWFPPPYARMLGGLELFVLVIACDLVLGPLISLVIYNPDKSRRKLVGDYICVGVLQVAALLYGLHVVVGTRPVFVVFAVDRYEVVTASELADEDLAQVTHPGFARLPWTGGPRLGWVLPAQNDQEHNALLFSAMAGKDVHLFPQRYRPVSQGREAILAKARPLDALRQKFPGAATEIDAELARRGRTADQVRWLPAAHATGCWTTLIDVQTAEPVGWLALDPYTV